MFHLNFLLLNVILNRTGSLVKPFYTVICGNILCMKAYLPLFVACMACIQGVDRGEGTFLVNLSPSPLNVCHAGYIVCNAIVKIKLQ